MTKKELRRFVKRWLLNRRFKLVDRLSCWVGRWLSDHATANHVTLIGLLSCIPMTNFYLLDAYWPAGVLLTFSLLTDFADGALAHYQQGRRPSMTLEEERCLTWKQRIDYRGVTHLGKSLDPITDKVRFFCVLYALGIGVVSTWLVIALTVVAVLLTVIRPIKRRFKMGDGTSNRFGKFKIWAELFAMVLLIFAPTSPTLLNLTFIVALVLGLFSLAGHVIAGYVAWHTRRLGTKKWLRRERADVLPPGFEAEDF